MSKSGCWSCGSPFHHRRNCGREVSKDSAVLTKKESVADQRFAMPKSAAEKDKWHQKMSIRDQDPLPRHFLRQHLDTQLQFLHELQVELRDHEKVNAAEVTGHRSTILQLQEEFRNRLSDMRDVAAHSRNYLIKLGSSAKSDEDEIFLYTLEQFNDSRPILWNKICKIIADMNEVERILPNLDSLIVVLDMEMNECQVALAERSARVVELDSSLFEKLSTITPRLMEASETLSLICKVMDENSCSHYKETLASLESKFKLLSETRKQRLQENVEELSEVDACQICIAERKNVAFLCGHQVCSSCLQRMRNNPILNRNGQPLACPFCKTVVARVIRLFN